MGTRPALANPHEFPPSELRKTPSSGVAISILAGSRGSMAMADTAARSGNPLSNFCQLVPPSLLFNKPFEVPAKRTEESNGWAARLPMLSNSDGKSTRDHV